MAEAETSPGEMRPLRDYYTYQMSPSPMSSPVPDLSPDLSKVVNKDDIQLTRSMSCNTALSSCPSVLAASIVDGVINGCMPSDCSATLTFQELRVSVELGGVMRTVLDSVSGYAEPGKMLGIIGPPRSGTSTLLDTLAGKLTRNAVYEGEILINGRRQQLTYGTAAHVSNGDVLIETLTVQETVYMSALLRLPVSIPYKEKILVAERTIQDMGLWECAAVRVGSSFYQSGLTYGERRRLSIALELLTRPHLVYLDEPLTGLDSPSALTLMARLKCLAMDWGRTIIGTFHHASADSFELIDNLCLLVRGRMVYFGEASSAAEHFARSGYSCLPGYNLPEYLLRTLDPAYDQVIGSVSSVASAFLLEDPGKRDMKQLLKEHTAQVVRSLTSSYANSSLAAIAATRRKELAKKKGAVLVFNGRHASFKLQVAILSYRSILNCTRDLSYFWCRLGVSVLLMIAVGTIFSDLGNVDQSNDSIQARFTCLFVILESMMLVAVIGGTPFYFSELRVYFKDRRNPHYGPGAFVVGSTAAGVPFAWVTSAVTACVVYFMPGLHTGFEQFAYFAALLMPAALLAADGLVQVAIAALLLLPPPMPTPSAYAALALAIAIQVVCMLVAGFFRLLQDLPKPVWRYPFSYVSFHTYALRGLAVNEFLSAKEPNTLLQVESNVIHHLYGTEHLSKWRDLIVVIGVAIACRFLLYFFLVAHDNLQSYFRLWQIQHENKTISKRSVVEQTRRLSKSLTPPHRSMVSSTASEEFEMRLKRSKDVNELAIVTLQV
ncbi:unnamed protein product [Calypogeia fissa]